MIHNSQIISDEYFYEGTFSLLRPKWLHSELNALTGEHIKIAVIDSGCSAFMMNDSRLLKGKSFIKEGVGFILKENENYIDSLGHGTACIDIILQVAPSSKILPVKVFGSKLETSIEILVEALNFAIDQEVDIINLSLGTKLHEALYPLYNVCERAKGKEIIIVSANANMDVNSYPAIFENVISVCSFKTDNKFDYKFHDDELCECLANGFCNDALTISGKRTNMNGNSFAAPVISSFIALLFQKYGRLKLQDIRKLLGVYSINNRDKLNINH